MKMFSVQASQADLKLYERRNYSLHIMPTLPGHCRELWKKKGGRDIHAVKQTTGQRGRQRERTRTEGDRAREITRHTGRGWQQVRRPYPYSAANKQFYGFCAGEKKYYETCFCFLRVYGLTACMFTYVFTCVHVCMHACMSQKLMSGLLSVWLSVCLSNLFFVFPDRVSLCSPGYPGLTL